MVSYVQEAHPSRASYMVHDVVHPRHHAVFVCGAKPVQDVRNPDGTQITQEKPEEVRFLGPGQAGAHGEGRRFFAFPQSLWCHKSLRRLSLGVCMLPQVGASLSLGAWWSMGCWGDMIPASQQHSFGQEWKLYPSSKQSGFSFRALRTMHSRRYRVW